MNSFLSKSIVFSLLLISTFFAAAQAQTTSAEKSDSVASYIRDKEEDSGLVRKRLAQPGSNKKINPANPTSYELFDFEKQTFALINQKRTELDLQTLAWSDDAAKIARLHSENMAKYQFFSHQGIDGKMVNDRADFFGVTKWTALGENIAFNRGYQKPIECAVEKWMESVGHRENLLNSRWRESAVGIAVAADGTFYFTQVFLVRK